MQSTQNSKTCPNLYKLSELYKYVSNTSCQNYTSKSATPVWEVHAINHWQMTRQLQQFLDTVTFGRKERQTCTVTERLQQYRKTTQQKEPMTQQTTGENNN